MRTRKRKRKPKADQPQFRPGDVVQYLKQTKTGETWVYAMIEACNQRNFRISYEWFGKTYMHACERKDLK